MRHIETSGNAGAHAIYILASRTAACAHAKFNGIFRNPKFVPDINHGSPPSLKHNERIQCTPTMAPIITRKVQVIVYCRAPEIQVLLLQRPANRRSIWQPVTGKMDPEDRNFMHTASRELAEETGITDVLHFIETGVEFGFKKTQQNFGKSLLEQKSSDSIQSFFQMNTWPSPGWRLPTLPPVLHGKPTARVYRLSCRV